MKIIFALILAFLAGCAQLGVPGIQDNKLNQVTRADLDAAIAISAAGGDKVAVACFTQLRDYLTPTDVTTTSIPQVQGIFSGLAAARNARRIIDQGVPENVHLACSPLVVESATLIGRLAATKH